MAWRDSYNGVDHPLTLDESEVTEGGWDRRTNIHHVRDTKIYRIIKKFVALAFFNVQKMHLCYWLLPMAMKKFFKSQNKNDIAI